MGLSEESYKPVVRVLETIRYSFMKTYLWYNGGYSGGLYDSLLLDLPRISSEYYVPKPRIYVYRSPRTRHPTYFEAVMQLPLKSSTDKHPEYIVVIANISYSKRFTVQRLMERIRRTNKRITQHIEKLIGDKHYFIYFIHGKHTTGVEETVRKAYAITRSRGRNTVIRSLQYSTTQQIIQDLKNYIGKRLEKILDPSLYRKSNGYLFSYHKRFTEYLLILYSLLSNNNSEAEATAHMLHNTYQQHIAKYMEIYRKINTEQEEIRTKKIRTLQYTPYI